MVVRLALIVIVVWMRGAHIFVDNSTSTLIHWFSPFRKVVGHILTHRVSVPQRLRCSSYKPITIWATSPL
eukprot:10539024-Lingulodinium_polyedra.AAC.1